MKSMGKMLGNALGMATTIRILNSIEMDVDGKKFSIDPFREIKKRR